MGKAFAARRPTPAALSDFFGDRDVQRNYLCPPVFRPPTKGNNKRQVRVRHDERAPKGGTHLFKHEKELLTTVRVDGPNPQYASMLVEQLGGGNGELKAAMQYMAQAIACTDPAIKDLLMDIASEELSHMEIVATTVKLLNGNEVSAKDVTSGTAEMHVLSGTAPLLVDASGVPWTAAYVNVTGDLITDLMSDAAAELRAKVVYEYLFRQIQDQGVRDVIDFLLNREEAHNALIQEAMQRVKGTGAMKDFGTTEDATRYFNLSTPGRYFKLEENEQPMMPNPVRPGSMTGQGENAGQYGPPSGGQYGGHGGGEFSRPGGGDFGPGSRHI